MPEHQALLQSLRSRLGDAAVRTGGDLQAYEVDWRRRWPGRALAVLLPGRTAEVAEAVRACRDAGVSLVPQGGNTGTVGGSVPDASGRQIVLSLRRMNRIHAIDADGMTLTAEAGAVLADVQRAAAAHGLLYPLRLASEGQCTLGGNLATNAGGTQVLRYGNTRELCLGLEVVTASGEVWQQLAGLRKDNSGYDLRDLFIGSEGTLGVITAATLRLFPQPAATATAWVGCTSLQRAVSLLQALRRRFDASLTAFEVMNAASLALVARHEPACAPPPGVSPWSVLVELGSPDPTQSLQQRLADELHAAAQAGTVTDGVIAHDTAQAERLWRTRDALPIAQARDGLNVKHDIAAPTAALPALTAALAERLQAGWPGCRLVTFGHLGDGNLHFNVAAPPGQSADAFVAAHESAINACVFDAVVRHGGSIAAEHGIGRLRRDALARYKSPVAIELMRRIKQTLDPQSLFNPGCLLPD